MLDWNVIVTYRHELVQGFLTTLHIAAIAAVLALAIGLLVGCGRTLPSFFVARICTLYADVLRNIPAVVKLFFAYFVLHLDALTAGIATLALHQSSYISDVVAAGIGALPKGQMEAVLSTGLSYRQGFVRVILPQALRITLPPLTTQLIQVVKNSSIVMLVALEELTFMTQKIEHETFRGMEAAVVATLGYVAIALIITFAMHGLQRVVDRKLPA